MKKILYLYWRWTTCCTCSKRVSVLSVRISWYHAMVTNKVFAPQIYACGSCLKYYIHPYLQQWKPKDAHPIL